MISLIADSRAAIAHLGRVIGSSLSNPWFRYKVFSTMRVPVNEPSAALIISEGTAG
jgi:hypothetical protein